MTHAPRRLSSDPVRHAVSVLCGLVTAQVLLVVLPRRTRQEVVLAPSAATFLGMAVYGVAFLVVTLWAFRGLQGDDLRDELLATRPAHRGWRRWLLSSGPVSWALTVSFTALVAVLVLVVAVRSAMPVSYRLTGIVCILGCWVLMLAIFACEYARRWAEDGGLVFPDGDDERRFGDFVYAAVQVSTTFSTSDVAVHGARTRQTVSAHCLTAWAYSSVVIALVVSLALAD